MPLKQISSIFGTIQNYLGQICKFYCNGRGKLNPGVYWDFALPFAVKNVQVLV